MRKQKNKQQRKNTNNTKTLPERQGSTELPTNEEASLLVQEASFSGPLPPPNMLMQYEQILPGMADRLVTIAENEQDQRHQIDNEIVNIEKNKVHGSIFISFVMVLAGGYCGYLGEPWLGAALGTTGPLAGVARILIKK